MMLQFQKQYFIPMFIIGLGQLVPFYAYAVITDTKTSKVISCDSAFNKKVVNDKGPYLKDEVHQAVESAYIVQNIFFKAIKD